MTRRAAITGATSFLGRKLTRALLNAGWQVTAIVRPDSANLASLPLDSNLTALTTPLSDVESRSAELRGCEVLFNLAWGASHRGERDDEQTNRQNVRNTLCAMRAAALAQCPLFVQAGSQAEYGYQERLTDEQAPLNPFSAYGRAKKEVCLQGRQLAAQLGLRYLHQRIFSTYGEGDHDYTLFMTCLRAMMSDAPIALTAGTQQWNFLYVDDYVTLTLRLAEWALRQMQPGQTECVNMASDDTRCLCEHVVRMKMALRSRSRLDFGAVTDDRPLSLRPDTSKLARLAGDRATLHTLEEGVILSKRRYDTI